ncbi:hypothetical protein GCM10023213_41480 [Prosthecobacter algae]|uniref:GmrSD restriction endonucleases N-terminal domain-containing protein n=1 Tax=Prosthecobacter algae TaxID=1144682 RepID=A0ABP9PIW6_9BACT
MSSQIKPSVTNPTIADIYQSVAANRLILRPDFQRRFVWTLAHQEEFIDTILRGYPFPEIYVCEGEVNVQELTTTRHVIDGQQRLTTIKRYIDGNPELPDRPYTSISPYKDLSVEQKQEFLSYQVVMRDIGRVSDETVREIFRRINLTKFKLENVEIHNAVYDGSFITAAKTILETTDLEKFGVFRESEFTRMADLHFILLVMATIENGGYFAQDREVEPMVAKYNEVYPSCDSVVTKIKKVFETITSLSLPLDSIWFRKSNFFTLVVETTLYLDQLPELEDFRSKLLDLEANILANKNNSHSAFSQYYSYMYQATHGRAARVTRSQFFRAHILGL